MSYLALARKWRPRAFSEVVGQEHVVSALIHALDENRLHHAFLFAGTRGVGKTTLARIFAKALNCEQGVSSSPCGACPTCQAVDDGRFIDLIEVDAASRTKVDDTRDLLSNVQYAPTQGRYKVYLIDEVHMLSTHSFNALLKTLEEPPPHVKFLLATTDPQKLPVTVLSRCLQFNLRALQQAAITDQQIKILEAEEITFQPSAIDILSRAAAGSLRDALSLLDQAISHGGGQVEEERVRAMLGMIEDKVVFSLLNALADRDAEKLMSVVKEMAQKTVSFTSALDDLLLGLHDISLYQNNPRLVEELDRNHPISSELAGRFSSEDVQLFYQIALIGKRDLPLAPDQQSGFEMVLLRMLVFSPDPLPEALSHTPPAGAGAKPKGAPREVKRTEKKAPVKEKKAQKNKEIIAESEVVMEQGSSTSVPHDPDSWECFVVDASLSGVVRELAMNIAPVFDPSKDQLRLMLDKAHQNLFSKGRAKEINRALTEWLGRKITVDFQIDDVVAQSPAKEKRDKITARQEEAERIIDQDPNIAELKRRFDATVIPGTVRPSEN